MTREELIVNIIVLCISSSYLLLYHFQTRKVERLIEKLERKINENIEYQKENIEFIKRKIKERKES